VERKLEEFFQNTQFESFFDRKNWCRTEVVLIDVENICDHVYILPNVNPEIISKKFWRFHTFSILRKDLDLTKDKEFENTEKYCFLKPKEYKFYTRTFIKEHEPLKDENFNLHWTETKDTEGKHCRIRIKTDLEQAQEFLETITGRTKFVNKERGPLLIVQHAKREKESFKTQSKEESSSDSDFDNENLELPKFSQKDRKFLNDYRKQIKSKVLTVKSINNQFHYYKPYGINFDFEEQKAERKSIRKQEFLTSAIRDFCLKDTSKLEEIFEQEYEDTEIDYKLPSRNDDLSILDKFSFFKDHHNNTEKCYYCDHLKFKDSKTHIETLNEYNITNPNGCLAICQTIPETRRDNYSLADFEQFENFFQDRVRIEQFLNPNEYINFKLYSIQRNIVEHAAYEEKLKIQKELVIETEQLGKTRSAKLLVTNELDLLKPDFTLKKYELFDKLNGLDRENFEFLRIQQDQINCLKSYINQIGIGNLFSDIKPENQDTDTWEKFVSEELDSYLRENLDNENYNLGALKLVNLFPKEKKKFKKGLKEHFSTIKLIEGTRQTIISRQILTFEVDLARAYINKRHHIRRDLKTERTYNHIDYIKRSPLQEKLQALYEIKNKLPRTYTKIIKGTDSPNIPIETKPLDWEKPEIKIELRKIQEKIIENIEEIHEDAKIAEIQEVEPIAAQNTSEKPTISREPTNVVAPYSQKILQENQNEEKNYREQGKTLQQISVKPKIKGKTTEEDKNSERDLLVEISSDSNSIIETEPKELQDFDFITKSEKKLRRTKIKPIISDIRKENKTKQQTVKDWLVKTEKNHKPNIPKVSIDFTKPKEQKEKTEKTKKKSKLTVSSQRFLCVKCGDELPTYQENTFLTRLKEKEKEEEIDRLKSIISDLTNELEELKASKEQQKLENPEQDPLNISEKSQNSQKQGTRIVKINCALLDNVPKLELFNKES